MVHTESCETVGYGAILLARQSNFDVMVHPTWQRRGVGRRLWERIRQDLSALGTVTVGPWVRAENTVALSWLAALGFSHVHQNGAVQLMLTTTDLSQFASTPAQLAKHNIVITTLSAEKENTPYYLAKYYRLFQEVEKDVPGYSPSSRTSYEQCVQELEQPGVLPESVFIARHDEEYVGLSILGVNVSEAALRFAGHGSLSQHLTGVHADYRRLGIALALKIRTIEYAQQHGYQRILSNSDNPAMQALNWKLGFRTGPWMIYNKRLD